MADVIEKDLTKVTSSNLTPITKPSSGTDKRYMRMVDKDGNSVDVEVPAFLRAAIRNELASILESGGTGGGSVLSVIGGILKTRTDADLASVLGVPIRDVHTQQTLSSYWVKIASTKFVKNENVQAAFLIESAYPQLYGILFINFRFSSSSVGNLVAKYVGSLDENCRVYYDPVVEGDIEIWVNLLGQYGHCCFRKLSECSRKNITNNMVLRDSGEITKAEVPTLTNYLVATPIS